jgi:RHS repeat-associated protein
LPPSPTSSSPSPIPAGVRIIGWDGQANTQIGLRTVPLDRLPLPPIPAGHQTTVVYMFSFGKVGGGVPQNASGTRVPIPVTFPNTVGAYPGQQVELWYYNEAPDGSRPNQWETYGLGTVSNDGRLIVSNPGVGIPQFCCGAGYVRTPPPPQNTPPDETAKDPCPDCQAQKQRADPVEASSGIFLHVQTDLRVTGRLPLPLTRVYRTNDPTVGPFGIGTSTGYDASLRQKTTDLVILFLPGNYKSRWTRQTDGSFTVEDKPSKRGARLTKQTDTTWTLRYKDGRTWRFNAAGWLTSQQDRNGNVVWVGRDSQNRISVLREPGGRELTFAYGGTDTKIQSVADPLGRQVRYQYDGSNRLTQVTDPAGGTWQYTYDPSHRMLTVTNPRSILQTQNTYDAAGRVETQTLADGGVTRFAYTVVAGTVVATTITDPAGASRRSRFAGGYARERIDAGGQSQTLVRAVGTNLLQAQTDPLGRTTRFTTDAAGNITQVTDPLGQEWRTTYDPTFTVPLTRTDPLQQTTTFAYDPKGNLTAVTDPLTQTTTLAYTATGDLLSITDALDQTTTFARDAAENLTATTDPLGHRTERTFDGVSRLLTITDPTGAVTRLTYDALDRVVAVTDPLHGVTGFTYDPLGNLLTVTDAKGQTTTHTYDAMNRLLTRTDALSRSERFTYDLNGNLKTATDRKGQVTTHTYDAQNRRIRTDSADGTSITYAFDPVGRLVSATDSVTGPITLAYDTLNRLTSEVTPQGAVGYGYDAVSRRIAMQASGLQPVTYGYDATSRLTRVTQGAQTAGLAYDPASRRMSLTLPNGITVEYQYDEASRLVGQVYRSNSGILGDLTYSYAANGNRIGTGGSFARTLVPASVSGSAYDQANQQLTFGATTQTFDANGNRLTQTNANGTTTHIWDARNRLIALTGPTISATFIYDALGRRTTKTLNGQSTSFLYDGLDAVKQSGPEGDTSYLRTLAIDEIVARADTSGTTTYITDTLGSTVALTDSIGAPVTMYTTAPFGETAVSGVPSPNPFQFTGRENDGTGLYYSRARYYDPSGARYISEDPIGFSGGDPNFYGYVWNSPLRWIDPLGLASIGSRPLDAKGIPFNGHFRIHHDQIWYDDGQNSGFFDDDSIRPDKRYDRQAYDFRRDPRYYDDVLMREAERNVQRNWDMDWRLLDNNCQHYTDTVRKEYDRLKRERGLRQLMK